MRLPARVGPINRRGRGCGFGFARGRRPARSHPGQVGALRQKSGSSDLGVQRRVAAKTRVVSFGRRPFNWFRPPAAVVAQGGFVPPAGAHAEATNAPHHRMEGLDPDGDSLKVWTLSILTKATKSSSPGCSWQGRAGRSFLLSRGCGRPVPVFPVLSQPAPAQAGVERGPPRNAFQVSISSTLRAAKGSSTCHLRHPDESQDP
jgi:hypothetical protein